MTESPDWDGPDQLAQQVARLWDRGRLLAARLTCEAMFPLRLRLRRPGPADLIDQFEAVRAWIKALEAGSRAALGAGYDLAWTEVNHRQLGRNRVPSGATVPTLDDAVRLIGREEDVARFEALAGLTLQAHPALSDWLARKPLTVLEFADDWARILAVVTWLDENPASGLYQRQIDLPGIDTKFIEQRRAIIDELMTTLRPESLRSGASFEARHGLRERSPLVRCRVLDPRLAIRGITDLAVPVEQLAALDLGPRCVFITENEINGLAFPDVEGGIVIFKLGYAVDLLARIEWLATCDVVYWGDIDTHGFAMLDRLKGLLPQARAILMDVETLLAHSAAWSQESVQHPGGLTRLNANEIALFDALRNGRYGDRVRLEQERVSIGRLHEALSLLPSKRPDA
jgi:hypothetical protein